MLKACKQYVLMERIICLRHDCIRFFNPFGRHVGCLSGWFRVFDRFWGFITHPIIAHVRCFRMACKVSPHADVYSSWQIRVILSTVAICIHLAAPEQPLVLMKRLPEIPVVKCDPVASSGPPPNCDKHVTLVSVHREMAIAFVFDFV